MLENISLLGKCLYSFDIMQGNIHIASILLGNISAASCTVVLGNISKASI
jgi:hypothetical protein